MSSIQERKVQAQRYETSVTQSAEELKLSDMWRFFLRRRLWIVGFSLLGLLCGFFVTIRSPRMYTATTTVELNKDASSGLGIQDLSGLASQGGVGQEFMTDMLTHQAVLLNDNTALSVINHLGLMQTHPYVDMPTGKMQADFARESILPLDQAPLTRDRALGIFRSGLRVVVVKNTRLLTVSYTDTDPQRASRIANAVVEAYLTNHTEARYTATSKASTWLTNQLEDLKRRVEESHKKASTFEQSAGLVGIASTASTKGGVPAQDSTNTAYQRLTAMNAELSRAEVQRIAKEAVYHLTETGDPDVVLGVGETSLATGLGQSSSISVDNKNIQLLQKMREQEASLKVQMAAEKVRYGTNNPAMQEIRNQIDSLEVQIHEELQRINREAKTDLELAKANEEAIRKSVDSQQRGVAALGNSLAALTFLQQEENTSRGLYQDLYTRLEEANIAAGVKSSDIVIVDPARAPGKHSSPVLKVNLAGGLLLGSLVGLLFAGVVHMRDTSLTALEDFENVWEFPLLGIIRRFDIPGRSKYLYGRPSAEIQKRTPSQETAWLLTAPKSEIAESYRNIRTSILLSSIDPVPRVILFTSPLSGDGKSTTAYNVAITFAVQNKRVLLLDADMRRPTIGRKSGCNGKRGLSDMLANDILFDEIVQQHPNLPSLYVLTSGSIPPMPAELLASDHFVRLIERMRDQFDYILIDAPPVLLVTDPLLLASSVDGIVLVVRAGVTTRPVMKRLRVALQKPNVKVLGYVLNGLRDDSEGYGYSYGADSKNAYFTNSTQMEGDDGSHPA
jgi:polysaccharide biosynthesis transport protein